MAEYICKNIRLEKWDIMNGRGACLSYLIRAGSRKSEDKELSLKETGQ